MTRKTRGRSTGPTSTVRERVYVRDGYACVRCASTQNLTIQHRINRAMGGSSDPGINLPVNLLTACHGCNMHFEAEPSAAYQYGWKVRRPADPGAVPVWVQAWGWVLLGNDFTLRPAPGQDRAEAAR
jgi:hypothetical protein